MTSQDSGPELDAARARIAGMELTGAAVSALSPLVRTLPLEALTPVKQLLKRYFSEQPWTEDDDEALADLVGAPAVPDAGTERSELAPGLVLVWGWAGDRFRLRVQDGDGPTDDGDALGALFGGVVVPEATPSPRTVRFATPPLGEGPSRTFTKENAADDVAVQQLFAVSEDVTDVLVGPNFVAVTLARPDAWESLLAPLLRAVGGAFTESSPPTRAVELPTRSAPGPGGPGANHAPRRLERAWNDLEAAGEGPDRDARILAATRDVTAERRQVAAVLLGELDPEVAMVHWTRLLTDSSRSVRRAAVDTIGDAQREELRPLLETALGDDDPWIRWRALRGIAQVGADASRAVVADLATDPDFRVRLEAARVVAGRG